MAIRLSLVGALAATISGLSAEHRDRIECKGDSNVFVLEAQAVPTATQLPCFYRLPVGWSYGVSEFRPGFVGTWLDSDRAGDRAVELVLTRTCDVSRAARVPVAGGPRGVARYEEPTALHPHDWVGYFRFSGGCVTYRFAFTREAAPSIFEQADRFLAFNSRATYVAGLRKDEGLTLCGTGAPPCPG